MNKMVDLHNHCLPGVDDGSKSIEEAVASIRYLKSKGIKDIVLTTHYIINTKYSSTVREREAIKQELERALNDDEIKLYLGNEIYIYSSQALIQLLKAGAITTLNGSRYLLIELPMHQRFRSIENVLCELNDAGYIPVIAHPERYSYIQKKYDRVYKLLEFDCRLQCNLTSLVGYYGNHAKRTVKKMLKEGLVSFLATDFHHRRSEDYIEKSFKKLKKVLSEEEIKKVLETNALAVLNDEDVPLPSVKYRKRNK